MNHAKLRCSYPSLISVLVRGAVHAGASDSLERKARVKEDQSYYLSHDPLVHDVIFTVQPHEPIPMAAVRLLRSIETVLAADKRFPRPSVIDQTNRTGYGIIAAEFDDRRRITTANFHTLSVGFFAAQIANLRPGCACLEIGPGNGWLRQIGPWPDVAYSAVDICAEMSGGKRAGGTVATARDLLFANETFDRVFGSLGDPFFYPAALHEIVRVLRPGGSFVFSAPSQEWARSLRPDDASDVTTFIRSDGVKAKVYSFTHMPDTLEELMRSSGFSTCQVREYCAMPALTQRQWGPGLVKHGDRLGSCSLIASR